MTTESSNNTTQHDTNTHNLNVRPACNHEHMTTQEPLEQLTSLANQIDIAIATHRSLSDELSARILECFGAGDDLETIAKNSGLALTSVQTRHAAWLQMQPVAS